MTPHQFITQTTPTSNPKNTKLHFSNPQTHRSRNTPNTPSLSPWILKKKQQFPFTVTIQFLPQLRDQFHISKPTIDPIKTTTTGRTESKSSILGTHPREIRIPASSPFHWIRSLMNYLQIWEPTKWTARQAGSISAVPVRNKVFIKPRGSRVAD